MDNASISPREGRLANIVAELDLSPEEGGALGEQLSGTIAVNVYRQLRAMKLAERAAGGCAIIGNCSNGGSDIIGNCSSSSSIGE